MIMVKRREDNLLDNSPGSKVMVMGLRFILRRKRISKQCVRTVPFGFPQNYSAKTRHYTLTLCLLGICEDNWRKVLKREIRIGKNDRGGE